MIRNFSWISIYISLFLLLLMSLAWTEANGFVSNNMVELWAKTIVQVESSVPFKSTDSFYPPVPYGLSLVVQLALRSPEVPVPFLLSAILGALVLVLWYFNLRDNGFPSFVSGLVIILLGLNAFFLRSISDGPQSVLCILGTWVFARGLVNLRLTGNAPDMMKVAVGLLVVALSDSFGLMLCLGALPFMIVAARPSMIEKSPTGYMLAMFYPVVAAIGSLLFVNMIFDTSLLPHPSEPSETLRPPNHALLLSGLGPATLVAVFRNIKLPRLFMPLFAATGTVLGAYFLNNVYKVEADPALAIAPMLSVLVASIRFWPELPLRGPIAVFLVGFCLTMSYLVLQDTSHTETEAWRNALRGEPSQVREPTEHVADFLRAKSDIMVDAERNAEIVTALNGIERLVVAGQPAYDWPLEGGLPQARHILVPRQDDAKVRADRVLRRFPQLKEGSLPNYRVVYQNAFWRVFERMDE